MNIRDISGNWEVYLDDSKTGKLPKKYEYVISLPNSTSNAQLGKMNDEKKYGCLTDLYKFEGHAYYRKTINVSQEESTKRLVLHLERTRKTTIYIDGIKKGEYCSLCTPHRYDLTGLSVGEHELVICVDNTDYPTGGGHLTSQDTQTNWNGITGEMSLISYSAYPYALRTTPDYDSKTVHICADVIGVMNGNAHITISDSHKEYADSIVEIADSHIDEVIKVSDDIPLWDEFSPTVLELKITVGEDSRVFPFGMRTMSTNGLKMLINGNETFLRGKHDGLIFPKTGFAPTTTEEWLDVLRTAKEYGINHYRFHTCCPPEAAFAAADILGVYMQPELPFWGTIPDELNEEHEFLRTEGYRMLSEFAHHPSFTMMSMGNELWGSKERLDEILAGYKAYAPDKLYVQGSNNYQFVPCILDHDDFFSGVRFDRDRLFRGSYASCDAPFGHVQTMQPNTSHNYNNIIVPESVSGGQQGGEILIQYGTEMKKVQAEDSGALVPNIPVVSHEVGQYYIYPNYDEIAKYTGSLRHHTYEGYRDTAKEKGLYNNWQKFFKASGALSVECYRNEIETAMRSDNLAGFQLLDLQDFTGQGTATVGILDPFMQSKGLVESEEWRRYCNDTVVLAELEKFVYTSGEEINCGLLISSTRPDYNTAEIKWEIKCGAETQSGSSKVTKGSGRISRAESVTFSVNSVAPAEATLTITAQGGITNSYTLYIYPEIDVQITENEICYNGKSLPIVHTVEECKDNNALVIPLLGEEALRGEYCTDFWCYGMFRSISESMNKPVPTGTLGLLINTESPLLSGFMCKEHTTPQWHSIISHSRCADLDGTDIEPDIMMIDNPQRAKRLGILYRNNGAVICTSRLWEIADNIEVKHFAASLVKEILG